MTQNRNKVETEYLGVNTSYTNSQTKEIQYQGQVMIDRRTLYTTLCKTPRLAAIQIDAILLKHGKQPRLLKPKI